MNPYSDPEAAMREAGFEPDDFLPGLLSAEEAALYHIELDCSFNTRLSFYVDSRSNPLVPHIVMHNMVEPTDCPCRAHTFGNLCAHYARALLVLRRRQARLQRDAHARMQEEQRRAEQERRESSPLEGNRGFRLLR